MSLPYPDMDFTSLTQLPAAELDKIVANIEYLDSKPVTKSMLDTSAGELGGAWESWTPTPTNMSGATLSFARRRLIGKTCEFRIKYLLTGANISAGGLMLSPPYTPAAGLATSSESRDPIGTAILRDNATATYIAYLAFTDVDKMQVYPMGTNASNVVVANTLGPTSPFTWAANDTINISGSYEVA